LKKLQETVKQLQKKLSQAEKKKLTAECAAGVINPKFTKRQEKRLLGFANNILLEYQERVGESESFEPPDYSYGYQGKDDDHKHIYVHPPEKRLKGLNFGDMLELPDWVSKLVF
jgi:hypothetical protein